MRIAARSLTLPTALLSLLLAPRVHAGDLSAESRKTIDDAVVKILGEEGAPSASIAVVKDGTIAYVNAYGSARLGPPAVPATPAMRYGIGSVSKQFTASAILLLAEEGRLSLDDRVVRYVPDLTRAKDITLRQLLSMTSGYQDYWPQDYPFPDMLKPATAPEILARWAKKPLDFEPGSRWQYSNTNYVLVGEIVQQVAGRPLVALLRERVFGPLGMTSVADIDEAPPGEGDPAGYRRFALGPLRPAPNLGKGWLYAAGELSMTAEDLARWDLAMIQEKVLTPASWRTLETEVPLASGAPTRYALGVSISVADGRRLVSHDGEVSGFTAHNDVYPDERAAVVVLVNRDGGDAASRISKKVGEVVLASSGDGREEAVAQARRILDDLQKGHLDRTLFTANTNAYLDDTAVADFAASLAPLGPLQDVAQKARNLRGGMTFRRFEVAYKKKKLTLTTRTMPDGKLEQWMLAPSEP